MNYMKCDIVEFPMWSPHFGITPIRKLKVTHKIHNPAHILLEQKLPLLAFQMSANIKCKCSS